MEPNDFDFKSDINPDKNSGADDRNPFESGEANNSDVGLGNDHNDGELGLAGDDFNFDSDINTPEVPELNPDARGDFSPNPIKTKREKERNWVSYASAALVIGFAMGVIYGYFVNPIVWVDAGIYHLREDLQEDYVRSLIDSYDLTDNQQLALKRIKELGEVRSVKVLAIVSANPGTQSLGKIQQLSALLNRDSGGEQFPPGDTGQPGFSTGNDGVPGRAGGIPPIYLACIILVLALVLIAVIFYLRKRSGTTSNGYEPTDTTNDYNQHDVESSQQNYSMGSENQPISQWMTTYLIGDDLFDDSFSIDTPSGEFMGECGVGIADTIGVGEPKRVGAFEVWLFDKNDIQTVTKVLMSEHAFSDETISSKLSAKGDPEMALTGHQVVLETATLQMTARIVDMTYGAGSLPDNSFFERMTIELAVWQK